MVVATNVVVCVFVIEYRVVGCHDDDDDDDVQKSLRLLVRVLSILDCELPSFCCDW